MNKLLAVALTMLVALAACKSKKAAVSPTAPSVESAEAMAEREVLNRLAAKPAAPEWVQLVADVTVEQNGNSNAGVADVRLHQGKQIWIEIADPLVGIKAIRAIALPDSVAYQNRIDRTYFAGPYTWVERKLGTSLPFNYIFNVFQGTPFTEKASVEFMESHIELQSEVAQGMTYSARLEPSNLDCMGQQLLTPKDVIRITYTNYKVVNGYRFPQNMVVEVSGSQKLKATFMVREIKTGKPLDMSFKLNTKYERIR